MAVINFKMLSATVDTSAAADLVSQTAAVKTTTLEANVRTLTNLCSNGLDPRKDMIHVASFRTSTVPRNTMFLQSWQENGLIMGMTEYELFVHDPVTILSPVSLHTVDLEKVQTAILAEQGYHCYSSFWAEMNAELDLMIEMVKAYPHVTIYKLFMLLTSDAERCYNRGILMDKIKKLQSKCVKIGFQISSSLYQADVQTIRSFPGVQVFELRDHTVASYQEVSEQLIQWIGQ